MDPSESIAVAEGDTAVFPEVWSVAARALAAGGRDLTGDALARTWDDFSSGYVTLAWDRTDGDGAKIIARVRHAARALWLLSSLPLR
jgi:hypothetical protein